MKNLALRKSLVGIVLASLCGTFLITNVVFGSPTQGPNDELYVSPTFNDVNVQQSLNVKTITTTDPAGIISILKTLQVANDLNLSGNLNLSGSDVSLSLNGSNFSGVVGKGLKGQTSITAGSNPVSVSGVALKGVTFTETLLPMGLTFALNSIITMKHFFAVGGITAYEDISAGGDFYAGGNSYVEGDGYFAKVNTAVLQNVNKNLNDPTSDPLLIKDDVTIVAGEGTGNPGNLSIAGEIRTDSNAKIRGNVDVQGNAIIAGATQLNDVNIDGNFGGGVVNRNSSPITVTPRAEGTATASCLNAHQFMTHCGYKLERSRGAGFIYDTGLLHVVDTNVVRNDAGVDTCTVVAYNQDAATNGYLTAQASCLKLNNQLDFQWWGNLYGNWQTYDWTAGGNYYIDPVSAQPGGGFTGNLDLRGDILYDFSRPFIPERFEVDIYEVPDPFDLNPGNVDPAPIDMQNEMHSTVEQMAQMF